MGLGWRTDLGEGLVWFGLCERLVGEGAVGSGWGFCGGVGDGS